MVVAARRSPLVSISFTVGVVNKPSTILIVSLPRLQSMYFRNMGDNMSGLALVAAPDN